ncbi:MAG: coenzyme F420-0:L-glutamate ligase [Candidatus Spechtbacterales bacterium]
MIIKPIKTRPFMPPKDDLFSLLEESIPKRRLKEGSILVVTSKVAAIGEGRCIKINESADKYTLIKKEADEYLSKDKMPRGYSFVLTIKGNILMPTAGIDESNANGYYILWPKKPFETAKKIYDFVEKEYRLKKFGVIISDSRTTPLRYGTMGVAIAFFGFSPLKDYRGTKDIFGRKLKVTQVNLADSLAIAAVATMGEGKEQMPIAVIEEIPFVKFGNFNFLKKNPLVISRRDDIYGPLLNAVEWEKGGK